MSTQPGTHPDYEFLKVNSDGDFIYEALEPGHFVDLLELIRGHPEIEESVTRGILHNEYDSAKKSGAQYFIEDNYDVQIDKGTGGLGDDAFEVLEESEGANVSIAGGDLSTCSPASDDPFQRVAENFAAACGLSNIEKGGELKQKMYLSLLADLLSVLPNLDTLVMPRAWADVFDITPLRALGVVIPY